MQPRTLFHPPLARGILALCLAGALFGQRSARAQEPLEPEDSRFEMAEVVVTASRLEETVVESPRSVTVITSQDIAQASSNNVVDLLAREANVYLRSFYGHDKSARVDIRGMGETSHSNVIVLVDGLRLNAPDLSGPDFSSVPLDQIERIEVVRGANSVVYGDGAVGGVIHIITKKGRAEPEGRVYTAAGAYGTFDGRSALRGRKGPVNYSLNADYYDSDGYRQNGYLRKKDAALNLGYDLNERLRLEAGGAYHEDRQGFPGFVDIDKMASSSGRRQASTPEDWGETHDRRLSGGAKADLGTWGTLRVQGRLRARVNRFILGYTPLKTEAEQANRIDEDTANLDWGLETPFSLGGREHLLHIGGDFYDTDYLSERLALNERQLGAVRSAGLFAASRWHLRDDLTLHLGYRYHEYSGRFRTDTLERRDTTKIWRAGTYRRRSWNPSALDLGLVYQALPNTVLFASVATSFRIPNVDEFALAADDLRPQRGRHLDLGLRQRVPGWGEFSVTLFGIRMQDEIFYDAAAATNRNFEDTTLRRGIELDFKWYPSEAVYLWGNATFMQATFDEKDTFIPLVPRTKATLGLEWSVFEGLVMALTGTYVGSRYDGNDENNDLFETLDAYGVVDGKLTYTRDRFKIFVGVNNILDEVYSTLAYSETYYPMPTRHVYGRVEWRF